MRWFIAFILLLLTIPAFSQSRNLAESARARMKQMRTSHFAYKDKLRAEHEAFKKEVMAKWGDKSMVESTKKEWVEYSDDKESRTKVDFESGTVTVEVISDKGEPQSATKARLEESVSNLLESKGKTIDFKSEVVEQKPVTEKPVLDGQIDTSKYVGPSVSKEGGKLAEKIVDSEQTESRKVQTQEGEKKISSITLQLAPDHLNQRARKYEGIINRYSKQFGVDEPLIYAVMEQESAFNPMARSHVAYGLMQLVPSSGGKDAYMYADKIDDEPTPEFLYNPDNNVRLGTAYLKILMERNFNNVKDKTNRMLCAIAAYNTGAGNVAKAFTGNTALGRAVEKINSMDNKSLFNHLKERLHHPEARDYVQKVTSKMVKYVK